MLAFLAFLELPVRYALNFFFGWLAAQGLGFFDPVTGAFSITVDNATTTIIGLVGSAAVFIWSRYAKRAGRKT